jgi:hypothetical protein
MKEVYRIKKGNLSIQTLNIPFDFGLVFEEDGIFHIDVYIAEQFDLLSFMHNEEKIYLKDNFFLKAKTDRNNELEATELALRNITPDQSLIKLQSYGFINHTEVRDNYGREEKEDDKNKNPTLFYLEIEGLKMQFNDLTETIKARVGIKINKFIIGACYRIYTIRTNDSLCSGSGHPVDRVAYIYQYQGHSGGEINSDLIYFY